MPVSDIAVVARSRNDVLPFDTALSLDRYLDRPIRPLKTDMTAAPRKSPATYRNVGVQTLPPANGNIFKEIYGREPSQRDYVHAMGCAGIGRYTSEPRSDHYGMMHGAANFARATAHAETYVDTGFQTASHDMKRKALAREKVKASMTAIKYRNAAFQAGYTICAESRDELIAHSEQFSARVQLDSEGNLLEGTIETRSLPNILGTPVLNPNPAPIIPRTAASPYIESFPGRAQHGNQGEVQEESQHRTPTRPINSTGQATTKKPRNSDASMSARDPYWTTPAHDTGQVFDGEHSSAGTEINENIICGPGATTSRSLQSSHHTSSLSKKSNSKADTPPKTSPVTLRAGTPASPHTLLGAPALDHKASQRPWQLNLHQEGTLNAKMRNIRSSPEHSPLQRKRPLDQVDLEPAQCMPDADRLSRSSSNNQQEEGSFQQKHSPGNTRDNFLGPSSATKAKHENSGVHATNGLDRRRHARVEARPISRASRKLRQPIAPYVPPAKRAGGC